MDILISQRNGVLLTMETWRSVIYARLSVWFCAACWGCVGLNELLDFVEFVGQIPDERRGVVHA